MSERRGWDIGFSTFKDRCDKIIIYPKETTMIIITVPSDRDVVVLCRDNPRDAYSLLLCCSFYDSNITLHAHHQSTQSRITITTTAHH